jgi:hypothetical protein
MQASKLALQIGMHGKGAGRAVLRYVSGHRNLVAKLPVRPEHHSPVQTSNFTSPQPGFETQQDYYMVADCMTMVADLP